MTALSSLRTTLNRGDRAAAADLVQSHLDLFNDRDVDAILAWLDPEVVWEPPPQFPVEGPIRGHDGVRRFFEGWFESMEDLEIEVESLARRDDLLAILLHQRGRDRASGLEIESRIGMVWTLGEARITRVRIFSSQPEALAAVGGSLSLRDIPGEEG